MFCKGNYMAAFRPGVVLLLGLLALSGCGRMDHLGRAPTMTEPDQGAEFNAMITPEIAYPEQYATPQARASLWAGSQSSLVADRRASRRGDILTVVIKIDDQAEMSNSSDRRRSAADEVSLPQLAGIPQRLDSILPDG